MLLNKTKKSKSKKNMHSRKYGQVKLRHARRGVYSCLFAILTYLTQVGLIAIAYIMQGNAPTVIGSLAWITAIFSGVGLYYGIQGFKEREKNYIMCKIGIGANTIIIALYIMLFIRGLF